VPRRSHRPSRLVASLLAVAICLYAAPEAVAAAPDGELALVVTLAEGREARAFASEVKADRRVRSAREVAGFEGLVQVTLGAADRRSLTRALLANSKVSAVELDPVVEVALVPNDPLYPSQWGHITRGVERAWAATTGTAVKVAVLDTGVNEVSELAGRVRYDLGASFISGEAHLTDDHGHGTPVAAIIAARGNNALGTAGLCWQCEIIPVKVLGANGLGTSTSIASGIVHATDAGAKIINISAGGPTGSTTLANAVTYANDRGALVVASAGNEGNELPFYPAAYAQALAIGGAQADHEPYPWTTRGSWVDIAAPGCNLAQRRDGSHNWFCGTSSAAPYTSGVLALRVSLAPTQTPLQLRSAARSTSTPLNWVANGYLDANAAVRSGIIPDPVVSISGPTTREIGPTTVTVSVSNLDTAHVDLLDGTGALIERRTTAPYSFSINLSFGATTLQARATATDGWVVSAPSVTLTGVDTTPPNLTITSPAPGTWVAGTVTFTHEVSDNDAVASVALISSTNAVLDSTTTAPYLTRLNTSNLADGNLLVRARASDPTGNVRTTSSLLLYVDNTPPSVQITQPAAGARLGGTVDVTTTANDNGELERVELVVGGAVVASAAGNRVTLDTRTLTDGTHSLRARAVDRAGNTALSSPVSIQVDNTLPSASITSPAAGQHVRSFSNVTVEAYDAGGVALVELLVGGVRFSSSPTLRTLEFDSWGLNDGPHDLQARVTDLTGNVVTSSPRTVIVDNTTPTAAIVSPTAGRHLRRSVSVDTGAADAGGIARVELLVDGVVVVTGTTRSLSLDTTKLANGTRSLRARVTDRAGNVTTSAAVSVVVDNVAPRVTVSSPSAGAVLRGRVAVRATGSDNLSVRRFEVLLNGVVVASSNVTETTTSITRTLYVDTTTRRNGSYTLQVRVLDRAGNPVTSTSRSVTIRN
jgi:hypothetical protein